MDANELKAGAGDLIADRRLFLTAGHKVVEEGDPEAAFLLASPGSTIPAAEVARLGLELKGKEITQKGNPAMIPAAGAVLDPRGALEAAVKDRLKADWEVKVKDEADKEMKKVESKTDDASDAHQLVLNRAGQLSREALRDRGEATRDNTPAVEEAARVEAKALEEGAERREEARQRAAKAAEPKRGGQK
jgi:hypothetical protein